MPAVRALSACTLMLALAACGGGGGGAADGGPTQSRTPSGTAAPAPATAPTSSGDTLYERAPIVSSCDAGQLKHSEKMLALDKLNAIRALHRLAPVVYDYQADIETSKSALISVANAKLSHAPTTDGKCYSAEGAGGSASSTLYIGYGHLPGTLASDTAVVSFLIDNGVTTLGHRRWLLHPFLSRTSFGRVDGAPLVSSPWSHFTGMSLKVAGFPEADVSGSSVEYIAYPEGDYPSAYFKHGWYMSFSVLANKTNSYANGSSAVDFSAATVQVRDANGALLAVSEQRADYSSFGIPNVLQWKAEGTANDVRYAVSIRGVKVGGVEKNYEYTFRIQ